MPTFKMKVIYRNKKGMKRIRKIATYNSVVHTSEKEARLNILKTHIASGHRVFKIESKRI